MNILNLYSGLGGNRAKWCNANNITAIEADPEIAKVYQNNNPSDEVIVGDALTYLQENQMNFDFIWSSPPCQSHSKMVKATRHKRKKVPDMSLYGIIIFLQNFYNGDWVVENVKPYYKPLIKPSFEIGRHLFWSNKTINTEDFIAPHIPNFINKSNTKAANELKEWLNIKYEGNIYYKGNHCPCQVLRNCLHPDTGKFILDSFNTPHK